ncbi:MAG: GNAT family N-acetyltransferase [Vicinamibacterales bacterium]
MTPETRRPHSRVSGADAWQFDWRTCWEDVWAPEFRSEWDRLLAASSSANVYHHPDLVRAWADTHGLAIGAQPFFGIANGPDGTHVLCTFVVIVQRGRYAARRVLGPAGLSFFAYHDPLLAGSYDPGRVDWSAFWDALRSSVGDRCDHALIPSVHATFAAGPLARTAGDESPVLALAGLASLDEALGRCSANHRGDVGRRLRRLRERGEVAFSIADGQASAGGALEDFHERFVPAYTTYWRSRPEGCMLDRPGVRAFVERVVSEGVPSGWAHYDRLSLNGRSIAWHIGLTFRNRMYWWIPAHDLAWQRSSPGKVLLAMLIERAIASGVEELHLLTGAQRYKVEWQADVVTLSTLGWHAPSAKGTVLAWYDASCRFMRR